MAEARLYTFAATALVLAVLALSGNPGPSQAQDAGAEPQGSSDQPEMTSEDADTGVTTRGSYTTAIFYSKYVEGLQLSYRDRAYSIAGTHGHSAVAVGRYDDGIFFKKRAGKDRYPDGGVFFTEEGCSNYSGGTCTSRSKEQLIASIGGRERPTLFLHNNKNYRDGRRSQALIAENNAVWSTVHFENRGGGDVLWVTKGAGGQGRFINAYDPATNSDVFTVKSDGTTQVRVLEVLGGADLAEEFAFEAEGITSSLDPQPGMVVSIDSVNEGKIKLSEQAYDRGVAGVVSGANGLDAGMRLGVDDSDPSERRPIALTGRVNVRCDLSGGEIRPGDLLTTSERPGHCMKVNDYSRAQGAILGKAMGSLDRESGLVLALVTLQ